jgi:hypothetical protein
MRILIALALLTTILLLFLTVALLIITVNLGMGAIMTRLFDLVSTDTTIITSLRHHRTAKEILNIHIKALKKKIS